MLIPKFMTSSTGKQVVTIHILANISRSKGNKIWLVKGILNEKYFSAKIMQKIRQWDYFQTVIFLKIMLINTLISKYVGSLRLGHTTKTSCTKFPTVDPEVCLILIFWKCVWDYFIFFFFFFDNFKKLKLTWKTKQKQNK